VVAVEEKQEPGKNKRRNIDEIHKCDRVIKMIDRRREGRNTDQAIIDEVTALLAVRKNPWREKNDPRSFYFPEVHGLIMVGG